jgi:hypothetical protein
MSYFWTAIASAASVRRTRSRDARNVLPPGHGRGQVGVTDRHDGQVGLEDEEQARGGLEQRAEVRLGGLLASPLLPRLVRPPLLRHVAEDEDHAHGSAVVGLDRGGTVLDGPLGPVAGD